jgi:hypothetical protein
MTHAPRTRGNRSARQRGMALLIAVAMLSLVGVVIGAAMSFAHSDVRRTSAMHEQAQARLLLVAALHVGPAPLPSLPTPECRWHATPLSDEPRPSGSGSGAMGAVEPPLPDGRGSSERVEPPLPHGRGSSSLSHAQREVSVQCGSTRAWQRMGPRGERWVIVAAGSGGEFHGDPVGNSGGQTVPSTP